jgi:bifunctional DNA-binding transcriptional regulator/antitoxin component of YhaV-PrlF toxin-antitoxin module
VIIKDMTTSLTGKNQLTVPAAIAKQLELQPGSRFEWSLGDEPGLILLRVQKSRKQILREIRELADEWKKNLPPDYDPVEELIKEREAEDRERYAKLGEIGRR